MVKLIRRLETLKQTDEKAAGAKAAMLGEIFAADLAQVPPGFVVTATGLQVYLKKNQLDLLIQKSLKNLGFDDARALNQASDRIVTAIKKAPLSQQLERAITKAYHQLSKPQGDEVLVAVRPSLAGDGRASPSLGSQLSFLNVKGATKVIGAIHKLYSREYEPTALYLRRLQDLDPLTFSLGVIVQQMVVPTVSGVLLTSDPILHDPEKLVIEAIWGLGDALVQGVLSPDRYIIDKQTLRVLSQKVSSQTWKLEYDQSKTAHISVAAADQHKAKLGAEAILELARMGKAIEAHFHLPLEIEWALEGQSRLWILDVGPVSGKVAARKRSVVVPVAGAKKPATRVEPGAVGEVIVKGIGASIGLAVGPVKIVHNPHQASEISPGSVLVTEMTSPLYIQGMRQAAAVVTDTGGVTSHASLAARELGIPCVVGTGLGTHYLNNGQVVTVDGVKGVVYKGRVHPDEIKNDHKVSDFGFRISDLPVITGTKVYVNLSDPSAALKAAQLPVDGVGLMRAEFLIAQIGEHPVQAIKKAKTKQYSAKLADGISQVAGAFAPRPVFYRLNDFKTNEYRDLAGGTAYEPQESNPMLGWRGARRFIDQPQVVSLELQTIAQLRQSGLKNLHIMIPFIRTISELKQVAFLIQKAGLERGRDFKVWMMVEVPANLLLLEQFAGVGIDGVSIGSNDLAALILGVDRDNPGMAQFYDERDPAVLKAVTEVIARSRALGLTTSVCGNAASIYPEFLETVVRAGITSVSVATDAAVDTRRLIASIEKRVLLEHALDL